MTSQPSTTAEVDVTPLPTDPWHRDRVVALEPDGMLARFNAAGVLTPADVHVARRYGALLEEDDESLLLALALTVRAIRHGSVCLRPDTVRDTIVEARVADEGESEATATELKALPWPEPADWLSRLRESPLVGRDASVGPLRIEGEQVYLDRYWREEGQVAADLAARISAAQPDVDEALLASGLDRVFAPASHRDWTEQRQAALVACRQRSTVLTGGPGTGKTTTVAALLALVAEQHQERGGGRLRIGLAAPTARAAARLAEAVAEESARLPEQDRDRLGHLEATTLHRLLGATGRSSSRFRHHRGNRLPHDLIVVDETSMVSLTMMARLLEAVRPGSRLVLVGDRDQLASVEAGAVLADLVDGLDGYRAQHPDAPAEVARLATNRRAHSQTLRDLAVALRDRRADDVVDLLRSGDPAVEFVETEQPEAVLRDDLVARTIAVTGAAGTPGADAVRLQSQHRLLCAHREGPYGVAHWNRLVERWLAEETGEQHWTPWYLGRPVLVTANDYGLGIHNGDSGVAVLRDGRLSVQLEGRQELLATSRLSAVETMHALTIHKAQGGQAPEVTVLLPDQESRLLTIELLYTAVTRAQDRVRLVGTEESVRAAMSRRVDRATGLAERLSAGIG